MAKMWFFSQFFPKNVITSTKFEYFKAVPVFSMIIRSHPCIFRFSAIFFQLSPLAEHCVQWKFLYSPCIFLLQKIDLFVQKIFGKEKLINETIKIFFLKISFCIDLKNYPEKSWKFHCRSSYMIVTGSCRSYF